MADAAAEEFARLLQHASALVGERRFTEAMDVYRRAMAVAPGHGLPFTKLSVLSARTTWGDPPLPRPPAPPDRPRVSMTSLGKLGRFGNQVLQYAYLRLYAENCGAEVETGDWIGRDLFALDDAQVSRALPRLAEGTFDAAAALAPGAAPRPDVDLYGNFSSGYGPHKARFMELFQLRGAADAAFERGWRQADAEGRTVVAIHLRRGDFGYDRFWIAPAAWYEKWLEGLWPRLHNPLLYVASDDPAAAAAFERHRPLTAAALNVFPPDLAFVQDFFVLTRADVLGISNSTFSFVAAMLNRTARSTFRPDPWARAMRPFDPWNSPVLLNAPHYGSATCKTRASEAAFARAVISPANTVFDVGARRGEWSRMVQDQLKGRVRIHAFEPNPAAFGWLAAWAETAQPGCVEAVQAAAGRNSGTRKLHIDECEDGLSDSCSHRLPLVDGEMPPPRIEVPCLALDDYCLEQGVRHIHFVKIDVGGAEVEVLEGCRRMLAHARIDFLQFQYGATRQVSGARLRDVFGLLEAYGYRLFHIGAQLRYVPRWNDALEDIQYANYVAVHSRLTPYFGVGEHKMPDLAAIVAEHHVSVKGAIHVGAHLGEETEAYRKLGVPRMLLIEASPQLFTEMKAKYVAVAGMLLVNRTLADANETRPFHLTSSTQSGSLLPLGRHAEVYPQTVQQGRIEVQCVRLDDLLAELGETAEAYNILRLGVNGAELMVLRGAQATLPTVEMVSVDVNFCELYSGCPQIDEVDDFLLARGFARIALACPHHPSWGNAVYLRRRQDC